MNSQEQQEWNELIRQLEQLGFYKYTDAAAIQEVQARILEIGYLFDERTQRAYFADEEELAEGGVLDFLDTIDPFLKMQGTIIRDKTEDYEYADGCRYSVTIDGKDFAIYTDEECQNQGLSIWGLSSRRTSHLVNTLLERAGSEERIYMLYGGNDATALFLTPPIFAVIKATSLLPEREKPYSADW